ncbi:MAG: hypothetical protein Q8O79_00980 [Pseudomonadota bacterium]|nr:hypothetical protein [Pseudomonadota bacterium]
MTPETLKSRTQTGLVLLIIVLAFCAVGSGDYADALEHENARLKAAVGYCQLAQSLREGQP